jgi:hypothetical protein
MRVLCIAATLATACAFTSQPAAFTTNSPLVGERQTDNVLASSNAHRNRKSTIVMDGKANGEFNVVSVPDPRIRTKCILHKTRTSRQENCNMANPSSCHNHHLELGECVW